MTDISGNDEEGVIMVDLMSQHNAVWAVVLINDLVGSGISKQQLLEGTGLNPDAIKQEKARAPFKNIARLFENAAQITNDDILGFHLGQKRNLMRGGVLSYVGIFPRPLQIFLKTLHVTGVFLAMPSRSALIT